MIDGRKNIRRLSQLEVEAMCIKITSLVDTLTDGSFQAEFGLSLYIEAYGKKLLLDTGAGQALLPNAKILGIDLDSLDGVILSHGHYDHTGGLAALAPKCPVYAVQGITEPCFSRRDDGVQHWISMPQESQRILDASGIRNISEFTEIFSEIYLTGPIERNSGEGCGGHFYTDETCCIANTVPEEQAVLLENGVLITGCCHAGLINTIEACRKARPDISIRAIAGGLHLLHANEERLKLTVDYLNALPDLEQVILMHCTGVDAGEYLKQKLKCNVTWIKVGQTEKLQ